MKTNTTTGVLPKMLVEDMPLMKGIVTLIGLDIKKRFRGAKEESACISKTHYEELIEDSIYLVSKLGIKKFSTEYMGKKDPRLAVDALEKYLKSRKVFHENNKTVKAVFPNIKKGEWIKKEGEEEDSKSQIRSLMKHNRLFTVIKCLEENDDYTAVASRFKVSVRQLKAKYVEDYCAIMIDLQNMVNMARKEEEENEKREPEEETSMMSEKDESKTKAFVYWWFSTG
ncbi:hypothetical protein Tco_0036212, partial [Tanacetum coccineum]